MLEIQALTVHHGDHRVLADISLSLPIATLTVVHGEYRSGKSTLLGAIGGLVRPSAGRLAWGGNEIACQLPAQLVRQGVVLVTDQPRLFPGLTVEENLLMGAHWRKDKRHIAADLGKVYSTIVPVLGALRSRIATTLSGGEQRLLAIGRAYMACPSLLLIDDVSGGLAPTTAGLVWRCLRTLADGGMTIIVAVPSIDAHAACPDLRLHLREGRLEVVDDA
jgi:branched-chain amino acid transport system ATP-binding protein